jgi:hypothetical protein
MADCTGVVASILMPVVLGQPYLREAQDVMVIAVSRITVA